MQIKLAKITIPIYRVIELFSGFLDKTEFEVLDLNNIKIPILQKMISGFYQDPGPFFKVFAFVQR